MLKSLRFGWRCFAFLVNTLLCWICFETARLLRGKQAHAEVANRWVPRWARNNLRIFGVHWQAHGKYADEHCIYPHTAENGVGRIFIANHSSALDIPLTHALTAAHVISRHDLANWPIIGRGAKRIGTLFVDRESRRSGADVLRKVAEVLARGEAVAMFPEGTAFAGDEVHRFRPGAFNAAIRAGAEVIPVGIVYGSDSAYYSQNAFLDHVKQLAMQRSVRVVVEIGEPLSDHPSNLELAETARERVVELVTRARQRLDE